MNNSPGMYIFQGKTDLDKPIKYFCLREELFIFDFALNMVTHIPHLAILHDDYEEVDCEITLFISDYVGVVQIFEQVYFQHCSFLLLAF